MDVFGLYWCVCTDSELGLTLRLARDAGGKDLLLTGEEAERAARQGAILRIAELEAELAKKRRYAS